MTTKIYFNCNVCGNSIPDDNEGTGFMIEGPDEEGTIDTRELGIYSIKEAGLHVCKRCSFFIGQAHNTRFNKEKN